MSIFISSQNDTDGITYETELDSLCPEREIQSRPHQHDGDYIRPDKIVDKIDCFHNTAD